MLKCPVRADSRKLIVLRRRVSPRSAAPRCYPFIISRISREWNYICTSPLEKLFSFKVTEEILSELGKNVDASLRKYTDRKFHSLEILEMMQ